MILCSCQHHFAPTAETFNGPQLFTDHATGESWLYLLLFTCPRAECASTRALVMFNGMGDEDEETPLAAE